MKRISAFALSALLWFPAIAAAAQCSAVSGERRVPLLELYTSEGCDSCPPADHWLGALPARGYGSDRVVALAFHVDYWNYLGWVDPFAQKRFTERQRHVAARSQSRVVYTPQFTLNGRDYRRGALRDDFGERIASLHRQKPQAALQLALATAPDSVAVSGSATIADAGERSLAQTWLALYENNLATDVKAGENRGKRLAHDFVVRDITGPLPVDAQGRVSLEHRFAVDARWKLRDLAVAAFVQNVKTGDVLQALALGCAPPS
jgi:hypothetical protein